MASDNQNPSAVGETVKGAAKGVGAVVLGSLAVVAGAAALVAAVVLLPAGITAAVVGGTALVAGAAYLGSSILAAGAAVGGGYGLYKAVSRGKEKEANHAQEQARRDQAIADTINATAQQAYVAGARDGQIHLVQELQKAQKAQQAQLSKVQENPTNFAAKVAHTRSSITPEAIIEKREAAASASNQIS
ncbi:MAG: hypothetical protein ABL867_06850 [Rickettsiales bacterium]